MNSDINLKHLEYFIKVAQLGSINKAAQALFISQPYLGKIINDLEYEAGCLLLNRSNHGVTLTPEGEEMCIRDRIKGDQKRHVLCVSFHYAKDRMKFPYASLELKRRKDNGDGYFD